MQIIDREWVDHSDDRFVLTIPLSFLSIFLDHSDLVAWLGITRNLRNSRKKDIYIYIVYIVYLVLSFVIKYIQNTLFDNDKHELHRLR